MQENNLVLSPPPLEVEIVSDEGKMTPTWMRWMTNVQEKWNNLSPTFMVPDTTVGMTPRITLSVPKMSLADRDALQDVGDGVVIYNTTDNKFNFRQNGTWVAPF